MEATEIDEFSKQVKEGGEKGLRSVSLAISALAVLVALVTVLGHRTHTEAVLLQTRAADQWNEYQAKKIRQGQISVASDLLSLQPSSNSVAVQHKLAEYNAHLAKWNDDLNEEQNEAQKLEAEVKLAERKAGHFDLAEALLSIGVVLSSITLLTRQNYYYIIGALMGVVGIFIALSAFALK
jgi:uncharacterized membrane protein YeiB